MFSFEYIRKTMGWCPQKIKFSSPENVFISDSTPGDKSLASYNPFEKMDVYLQMFDWRIWTVILIFTGLIVFGIAWAGIFSHVIPISLVLIALLILFSHTKLSVDNEVLRIRTPILKDIVIPKKSIKSIEIFENYGNRHKLRSLVSLIVMIMLSIYFAVNMPDSVMKILLFIASFLFIYILYFSIRISNYPWMIRLNTGVGYILLYPCNEHDFSILKYTAPLNPDSQGK